MNIQNLFQKPMWTMPSYEPHEPTTKEKVVSGLAVGMFVVFAIAKDLQNAHKESLARMSRILPATAFETTKSFQPLQLPSTAFETTVKTKSSAIRLLGPCHIPSGPTIIGYAPSALQYVGKSSSDVLSVANSIMRSPISRKEKIAKIQQLPLREFGISPDRFLTKLVRRGR